MLKDNKHLLKKAFIKSLPVFSGYMVLGMGFGILLRELGYGTLWALGSSVFIYAGAMQFVLLKMLGTGVSLISVAVTTLMVNARHLFYGISMMEKYKDAGAEKPYLVFALTDETYSILCTGEHPEGEDFYKYAFALSLMNQCYWVTGSVIGNLIGQALPFDTKGIEFSMTALFITVFVDQWLSSGNHASALMGIIVSVAGLMVFGSYNFLIPAMAGILAVLTLFRKQFDREDEEVKKKTDNIQDKERTSGGGQR